MQILPGSTIGILGDNTNNAPLIRHAHKMGLNVALFTEKKYENYRTEADYWFMGADQWTDFVGLSTVIIYNQNWLSFQMMDRLAKIDLPQGTTLLELTSDATLLRGLFEENAINILPYQLASTLDEVALAASALTYPVRVKSIFKTGQNSKSVILMGSWDLGLVAPLIDGGQLLVETWAVDTKQISLPIVIDQKDQYVSYPLLEATTQQGVKQLASGIKLEEEMEQALYETTSEILKAIQYVGALTINFLVTPEKNLYVHDIITGINPGQLVSEVGENLDIALQMLRAITGQALLPVENNVKNKVLSRSIEPEHLPRLYTQWEIRDNWILTVYPNVNAKGVVGEVVAIGDSWDKLQTQFDVSGIWLIDEEIND